MHNRVFTSILTLTTTLAFLVPSQAAGQIKVHRHLTVEDGLVQSQVNAIYEDRGGFVWFGTFGGLSRWDGREFVNFQTQDGLAALDIRTIYETDDGRILIGTGENGFSIFDGGKLTTFNENDGLPGNSVRAFCRGEDGRLSVATNNGIIIFADESLDTTDAVRSMKGRSVSGLSRCGSGGLYACTLGDGVFKLSGGRDEPIDPDGELPGKIIRTIHETADGTLFMSVYKQGVWLMNDGRFRPFEHNAALGGYDVKSMSEAGDGTLYMSTMGGGVALYRDGQLEVISKENGLQGPISWAVHAGASGVVYFGTWGGVSLYRPGQTVSFNQSTGLPGDGVNACAETPDGNFYFGTLGGGVAECDGSVIRRVFTTKDGLAHDLVWSLRTARDGTLYVGTHAGVNTLKEGRVRTLYYEPRENHGRVYGIHEAADGTVYFATYGGIRVYRGGEVVPLYDEPDPRRSSVYAICEGRDGELYFGTGKGIVVYRGAEVEIPASPAPLAAVKVWGIHQGGDGAMYFGTNGTGLFIMKGGLAPDGTLDTLDVSRGLSDNTVYRILEDDAGRLYLTTHRGVNIMGAGPREPSLRRLGFNDGLGSNECNQGSAFEDSRGRMWFGTVRGVSCYDPALDIPDTAAPIVHFTRVRLFERELPLSGFAEAPDFDHDQNYFKFEFVGTHPPAPEKVEYRYRLTNIDRDWVYSKQTLVQYTALPPDDYVFEVSAGNGWGYWSEPLSIRFSIEPPFWNTWWFITLAVMTVGGTITLIVVNRVRHALAIERLRTRIAADLHDDVGAGLTEISITGEVMARKLPEAVRENVSGELDRIGQASRHLVGSMSDIVWLVNPKRDSLDDLVARLGDVYKDAVADAGVTFHVNNLESLRNFRLPMEMRQNIFLLFKEAINNALKYSGCSTITLDVAATSRGFAVRLADDGCGFDPAAVSHGNGLDNMRARASAVRARVRIESAPGKGTVVSLEKQGTNRVRAWAARG